MVLKDDGIDLRYMDEVGLGSCILFAKPKPN